MSDKDTYPADDREFDDDEIEILEVVGVDDDLPPSVSDDPDEPRDDEVEVRFEDDDMERGGGDRGIGIGASTSDVTADGDEHERFLRLRAEFDNFQKRVEREKREFYEHATSTLVRRLLPVLDNFERAVTHAEESNAVGDGFLEGVRLIQKQLVEELSKQGLREVDAIGRLFDPAVHEAVATERDDHNAPNTVVAEFQRGYFFNDRLLRPALVKVNIVPEMNESDHGAADGGSRPTES